MSSLSSNSITVTRLFYYISFENEEKRKQEMYNMEKSQTPTVDNNADSNPPIMMRMKLLLNHALLDAGSFAIQCPTDDCNYKISPLRYAVHGPNISTLSLCCVECAETSNEDVIRKIEMDRKRALVYMYHAGTNIQTICAICDLQKVPVNILTGDWEMAHKVSGKWGGSDDIENLFPAHSICNNEQHARSLSEIRRAAGFTSQPFPNLMASVDEAKKTRIQLLKSRG